MFAARNADKLAQHFYEQGRADALRNSAKEAKNINKKERCKPNPVRSLELFREILVQN